MIKGNQISKNRKYCQVAEMSNGWLIDIHIINRLVAYREENRMDFGRVSVYGKCR